MKSHINDKFTNGDTANSERLSSRNFNEQFIYVKYVDFYIPFKKRQTGKKQPIVRNLVGWLVLQDKNNIWICYDLPILPISIDKVHASGCIIKRKDVIEIRNLSTLKKCNCEQNSNREFIGGYTV